MKKIYLCLLVFIVYCRQNSYGQTGACCLPDSTCLNATSQSSCTAVTGARWLNGLPCENASGKKSCFSPTSICCDHGVCRPDVSQEDCKKSGADNKWQSAGDCSFCQSFGTSVSISSFSGIYSEETQSVQISWDLDPAMDKKDLFIQRSRDGASFNDIGYMDLSSNALGAFDFTDINPYTVGYYRLNFTKTGQLAYSQIITVVGLEKGILLLIPNPAAGSVRVLLNNMQLYNVSVSIMDISGRIALKHNLKNGELSLDISNLPAGIFMVRAEQNGKVYTGKLIKN